MSGAAVFAAEMLVALVQQEGYEDDLEEEALAAIICSCCGSM